MYTQHTHSLNAMSDAAQEAPSPFPEHNVADACAAGMTLSCGPHQLTLLRALGKGKSAHSWLVEEGGARFVLKVMHDEPCPYYTFHEAKTIAEQRDYATLLRIGVPLPRLLHVDHERGMLLKEWVDGIDGMRLVANGLPERDIILQLLSLSRRCREAGCNLDWFPANMVVHNGALTYVDYEVNGYDPRWSLEQWGFYYWANVEGVRQLLRNGDITRLNDADGLPRRDGLEAIVRSWIDVMANSDAVAT